MKKRKVMLIGIDGATWRVIKPLVSSGKLPAFKELIVNGAHGALASTIPPLSPSAWTSIYTGTNPGKHNIFRFVKRKEDSYFIRPISSKDRKATPIWRLISDSGKRCILLNIPFAYPPDRVNGIMTTGLGTPSKSSEFAFPKQFKDELFKKFPNYDVDFNEDLILLGSDKDPIEHINMITEEQIKLAKYLFNNEAWDFYSVVLRSIDVIQHYYWNNKNAILDCYQKMDELLNWTLNNITDDTTLFICSDHGFAPIHTCVYMNNWLESQGFLKINPQKPKGVKKMLPSAETFQKTLLKLGMKNLVWKLKRSKNLEAIIGSVVTSERTRHIFNIIWTKTPAYFMEASFGMINVNLEGREPQGFISVKDREALRSKVIRAALKLKDPDTGEMVIIKAYKGEQLFNGNSQEIPDIVLLKNDGYKLIGGYNYSGKIFEPEEIRFGDHDEYGIFAAYGAGIRKCGKLKGTKIFDIAPTILHVLRMAVPSEMDGRVIQEILKKGYTCARVKSEASARDWIQEKHEIDEKVKNLITNGNI